MKQSHLIILIIAVVAIIVNILLTDFDKFWELNSLFRFSMPLVVIIIVLLVLRKDKGAKT